MKLATRINSYFRDGDKNLDRVFAEFQSVGLTHVDLNYPEHCTGVTAEDMAAKLAAHDLQLNGCALRFRNAFLNGDLGNADDALAAEALELCYEACDYCRTAGGNTVTIWLGHDGFDYICPFTFACNFAVIGCAFGVFLKARDQKLKSFAMTGVVSIALSAIIEPTLFGMLVKNKKVWLAQIIGGAVGGAFLGIMKVVTTAFTFGSVTTFPAFVSSDPMNFAWAMVGMLISAVVAGVLAFAFTGKEDQLA